MSKPKYSIEAPDQPRLKRARAEIEAVMQKHDLAGVCILHTPGMTEWFYQLNPSYSRLFIDEIAMMARVRSRLVEDHGGDRQAQLLDQACTANMVAGLMGELVRTTGMFGYLQQIVDHALRAEHTPGNFVPDPTEGKMQ